VEKEEEKEDGGMRGRREMEVGEGDVTKDKIKIKRYKKKHKNSRRCNQGKIVKSSTLLQHCLVIEHILVRELTLVRKDILPCNTWQHSASTLPRNRTHSTKRTHSSKRTHSTMQCLATLCFNIASQ
jgi:hypothetical protein